MNNYRLLHVKNPNGVSENGNLVRINYENECIVKLIFLYF